MHKLFWIALRKLWSGWKESLVLVTPRTVVAWHRAGFRLYWKWLSRASRIGGRKRVSEEIRALIFRMAAENPTWGAPRIHGELLKLGFNLSEPTVSRWLRQIPRTPDPAQRWLTFLRNHRDAFAAMDFFTVPTLTLGVLYVFFIIGHDRRKILHCNVSRQPNALWIALQLREVWGYDQPHRADGFSSVLLDGRNNVSGKFRVAVKYRTLRGGNCFTRTSYEHTIPLSNLFADGDGRASFQK
jgi:hypothetical protein